MYVADGENNSLNLHARSTVSQCPFPLPTSEYSQMATRA